MNITRIEYVIYLVYKLVVYIVLALFWKLTKIDIFFQYITSITYRSAVYKLKSKIVLTLSSMFLDITQLTYLNFQDASLDLG